MALAASATAVLLALIILSMRVKAVAEKPALDPSELARASAGSRSAMSAPLSGTARGAPAVPEPGRPSIGRPGPSDGETRAAERHLEQQPPTVAPTAPAEPGTAEDAAVSRASEFYGTGDYENAVALATEFLKTDPTNERMLRIAVSSSCILGNADQARIHFERLSPRGQREIARRCSRYGIDL
jgi:hypothetical protein